MLNTILSFSSRFQAKELHTTNFSFKLVTRITVNILFFCILMSFSSAFLLGQVIECYTDAKYLGKLISYRCWAEGVYLDRTLLNGTIGGNVISPGIGVWHSNHDYIQQSYYQWIAPLMIMQGLIFYLPRGIWKLWENDVMKKLLGEKDGPIMNDKWKEKRNQLVLYMKNIKKKYHRWYVIKYFTCEVLSIAAIIVNMMLMKWILNDFWVEYQPAISALLHGNLKLFRQLSAVLFPLQAKCIYHVFGHTGTIELHDALCYLPLNVVNEKIFVLLYFWFIGILIFSTLNSIYFLTMLFFNSLRIVDIGRMCERSITRGECKKISGDGDFGYWFTLCLFHKNLNPVMFQDLAKELYTRSDENPSVVILGRSKVDDKEIY